MAKKKSSKHNILTCIFATIIIVGLVLAIVGMFVGQVGYSYRTLEGFQPKTATGSFKLFDDWGDFKIGLITIEGVSNTFSVVSFIVTIVGLVVLLADSCLHLFAKKDFKILRVIGAVLSVVGAILILVSGLVMANECYGSDNIKKALDAIEASIHAGAGVWLGFVGGLVGGIAGGLGLVKKFN